MTIEVRVPQLPESVADATLVSWHKQPGDAVARDENLVDLETDKVVLEVPAPARRRADGDQARGRHDGDQRPAPGADRGGAAVPRRSARQRRGRRTGARRGRRPPRRSRPTPMPARKLSPRPRSAWRRRTRSIRRRWPAPAATGASRSPTWSNHLQPRHRRPPPRGARPPAAPARCRRRRPPALRGARAEQRVPMTRLRARIAERMVQAQATQALLTSFNEVDLKAVNELRARYKDQFEKQHGVKLGFMSFFAKACVEALQEVSRRSTPRSTATTSSTTSTSTSASRSRPTAA